LILAFGQEGLGHVSDRDEVLGCIFGGTNRVLYREFEGWTRSSPRFRAFAASYCGKIRAKLKNVRELEGEEDLRAEFEAAYLLLRDERFTLEYERYAATKQRGPDFTVTFKTHTLFNVEVRHVRGGRADGNAEDYVFKLVAVLADKAAQMPPSSVNLLWLAADREISDDELRLATATLRQLAEQKVEPFFTHYGYESPTEFLRRYSRLSGVVVVLSGRRLVWLNPLARHKVPEAIANAIRRLETG
jgi:hypothetical protein